MKAANVIIELQQELGKSAKGFPEKFRQCCQRMREETSDPIRSCGATQKDASEAQTTEEDSYAVDFAEGYEFPDPESTGYRTKLRAVLEEQRKKRYAHLPAKWWLALLTMLILCSAALWIDGSPPGR